MQFYRVMSSFTINLKKKLHSSIIGHWKVPANYSELLSCRNEAVINPLSNFFYIINKRDNPQAGW